MYKIIGNFGNKKYESRKRFTTEKAATLYAYKNLVYNPSGNTKRKVQLTNMRIKKV